MKKTKTLNKVADISSRLFRIFERAMAPSLAAFDLYTRIRAHFKDPKTTCTECEATLWEGNKPGNWMRKVTDHLTICRKTPLSAKVGNEGSNSSRGSV